MARPSIGWRASAAWKGIVSKRINDRYEPDRRSWLKAKCLNREEFVVVGWSDPEGSRHRIGSLLLSYYTPDGKLTYAGRAGTGMDVAELERVWWRLRPLTVDKMPLPEPLARGSRFGSPLVLSRVHLHAAGIEPGVHAVSVELYLVQPIGAVRCLLDERGELGLYPDG